jgi:putative transposase
MEDQLSITAGLRCAYQGQPVIVRQVLDLTHIVVETGGGRAVIVAPQHLQQLPSQDPVPQEQDTYQFVGEEAQRTALARYAIIQPFLQQRLSPSLLAETLARYQISEATLRRWLRAYRRGGLTGLLKRKSTGGRQQSRLPEQREHVLQAALQQYLSLQCPALEHVYEALRVACSRQQVAVPALSTLRRRIDQLPPEVRIRRRRGAQVARQQCDPLRSSTLQPAYPLDVVEVDHALLNIVLLDEHTNQPVGRPWLTVALDVYSRMVVGFYLSLEQPGASATGLCLAHAILPKET